jgi:FolB domain-containing protein
MNKILISNLVAHAVIGVRADEQSIKQKLVIDLSFAVDIDRAALNDSLSDAQDYSVICSDIISFVEKTPCRLLETLAKKLSMYLNHQFHLNALQLKITKRPMDIPGVDVSVEVTD